MALKGGNRDALQFMGIPELWKQFNALTPTLQRGVLRKAVTAAGSAVSSAIRKAAPKDTGGLKRSLKKKPSSKWKRSRAMSAAGIIGIAVGHDYTIGPHSHLVNNDHVIANQYGSYGTQPGQQYISKALNNCKSTVKAKITAKARQALPKAIAKMVSKYKSKAALR